MKSGTRPVLEKYHKRPFIHIGLPRTGTKTIQWHLFSRHSGIEYLGIYDGNERFRHLRKLNNVRDPSVQTIMKEIGWENIFNPDLGLCKRLYAESIATAFDRGKIPVWSWESLSMDVFKNRRARAENLRQVFGPCRVAITIRHPVSIMESAYFQIMRRQNVHLRKGKTWYLPIDKWLNSRHFKKESWHHLEYERTISLYCNVFSEEAIRVFVFEDLRENPGGFIEKLCQFIGIDPEEGVRWAAGKAENARSAVTLDRIRQIGSSGVRSFIFRKMRQKKRNEYLFLSGERKEDELPRISSQGRNQIEDFTRKGESKAYGAICSAPG